MYANIYHVYLRLHVYTLIIYGSISNVKRKWIPAHALYAYNNDLPVLLIVYTQTILKI